MKGRRTRDSQNNLVAAVSPQEANAFEELSIQRLRQKGYRITMPRVQVIRVLAQANTALSAYAIHERIVAMSGRIDVVSVYRILATLLDAELIHHVGIVDGYLACRLEREHPNHTEHIVDRTTKVVKEVELPADAISSLEQQLAEHNFVPTRIKVEVEGDFIKK